MFTHRELRLGLMKVDVPDEYCGEQSYIAPGADSTLIYLNTYGCLNVYGPLPSIPSVQERKVVRIK